MHRAMPVSNKILSKKWQENNTKIHLEKLRNMQPRVNSGRPAEFCHLKTKAKREQILEDRFTEIERENRILLEKMNVIMNKRQLKDQSQEKKSLNQKARKIESRRINLENQALLKRLQERTPCYTIQQWEEERKKTELHLKNICEFPYIGTRGKSTPVNFKKPRKLSPISRPGVFKKGVEIGNKHFIVEIKKNKKNIVVFLNDIESPDSYSLRIPVEEALELMGGNFQYDQLVGLLEMEDGEIVLVDPGERGGHESAPARNNLKTDIGFGSKPKTGKVTQSYEYGKEKKKENEMSYTEYDGFHISARRKSADERYEENLKVDPKDFEEDESEEEKLDRAIEDDKNEDKEDFSENEDDKNVKKENFDEGENEDDKNVNNEDLSEHEENYEDENYEDENEINEHDSEEKDLVNEGIDKMPSDKDSEDSVSKSATLI